MLKLINWVLLSFALIHYGCSDYQPFLPKGLFQIRPVSIEKCPDTGTNEYDIDMHLRRINLKRVDIVGNFTVGITGDKNIKIEYILDRWGNGGWRLNSYIFKHNYACESLRTFVGELFIEMMGHCLEGDCLNKKSNQTLCPVITGRYELKHFDTKNFDQLNIPAAQVGKWRNTINFINSKNDKMIGCLRIMTSITQKRI